MILLFFARRDRESLNFLEDIFEMSKGACWFIEDKKTNQWMDPGGKLTTDPHQALKFPIQIHALSYMIWCNISQEDFIPTEHEFL